MNLHVICLAVAAGALLAATPSAWALPPRQHAFNGVIDDIDCAGRAITLRAEKHAQPVAFVWDNGTRFTKQGGCAGCGLASGGTVRVWYRREAGRNVLREVRATGASGGCAAPYK
jgi:hypothetical protein